MAIALDGLEGKAAGAGIGQHVEEGIHLDVQKDLPRHRLEGFCQRGLAGAADAIEQQDRQ